MEHSHAKNSSEAASGEAADNATHVENKTGDVVVNHGVKSIVCEHVPGGSG